jgi:hypothetical protein
MICNYIKAENCGTIESKKEGMIEVAWHSKSQLKSEVVYPELLLRNEWDILLSDDWQIECPV